MTQKLIEDNMKLVYYLIHTYYPSYGQDEDLIQSGMVGLCKAANSWDKDKSEFSTYASRCILNEMADEFKARKKHTNILSLDYEYSNEGDDAVTLKDIIPGAEDVDFTDANYDAFYDKLDPLDQSILELRKEGYTVREIGDKLGWSRHKISQRLIHMKYKWGMVNGD